MYKILSYLNKLLIAVIQYNNIVNTILELRTFHFYFQELLIFYAPTKLKTFIISMGLVDLQNDPAFIIIFANYFIQNAFAFVLQVTPKWNFFEEIYIVRYFDVIKYNYIVQPTVKENKLYNFPSTPHK